DSGVRRAHDDLEQSSAALRQAAAALDAVGARLPTARQAAAEARGTLAAARARDAAAAAALARARLEERVAEAAVVEAEGRVAERRNAIGALARAQYQQGGLGHLAVIVGSQSPGELADRVGLVRAVFRADNALLAELADERAALASRRALMRDTRARVATARQQAADGLVRSRAAAARAQAAERAIRALVEQRQSALDVARRERAADQRRYEQLQAESARLAALIRARATTRGEAGRAGSRGHRWRPSMDLPSRHAAGRMAWPANGGMTSGFGWRMHPIFHVMRFHAGIDIGGGYGAPVRAAADGTVIYAGPASGYGWLVVVDHGEIAGHDVATAYAHLSSDAVDVGEQVSAGETVGAIGNEGLSTGPHLHFEVRVDGTPVDPDWWV
ncbi:MAG TPA: peptidoglycan DD-metalloendopeptidase family protein, partial [Mycobacteriales bacterium]|nr:peptidoglycan DD-metalloendopeptidase family protein [Mycobacteriales bacterium]